MSELKPTVFENVEGWDKRKIKFIDAEGKLRLLLLATDSFTIKSNQEFASLQLKSSVLDEHRPQRYKLKEVGDIEKYQKKIPEEEVIVSGLQNVVDLCGLLDPYHGYNNPKSVKLDSKRKTNFDFICKSKSHQKTNLENKKFKNTSQTILINTNDNKPSVHLQDEIDQKIKHCAKANEILSKKASRDQEHNSIQTSRTEIYNTAVYKHCTAEGKKRKRKKEKNIEIESSNVQPLICSKKLSDDELKFKKENTKLPEGVGKSQRKPKVKKPKSSQEKLLKGKIICEKQSLSSSRKLKSDSNLSASFLPPLHIPPCGTLYSACKASGLYYFTRS